MVRLVSCLVGTDTPRHRDQTVEGGISWARSPISLGALATARCTPARVVDHLLSLRTPSTVVPATVGDEAFHVKPTMSGEGHHLLLTTGGSFMA